MSGRSALARPPCLFLVIRTKQAVPARTVLKRNPPDCNFKQPGFWRPDSTCFGLVQMEFLLLQYSKERPIPALSQEFIPCMEFDHHSRCATESINSAALSILKFLYAVKIRFPAHFRSRLAGNSEGMTTYIFHGKWRRKAAVSQRVLYFPRYIVC